MIKKLFSILSLCGCLLGATSCQYTTETVSTGRDLAIADSMFTHILDKYNVEKYGLLQETYPANPDNQVTYLAEGAEQKRNQEVSFLWPYSGMLSGGIALYKTTGDKKYLKVLEERILPGLEQYWDNIREPFCYQSYPMFNGESDRFYDDNDWLAIDFCDLYALTKNKKYLEKAQTLYNYIYSGWDDVLGGGIYWCEQKKTSKNTCSNAPAIINSLRSTDYLYPHTIFLFLLNPLFNLFHMESNSMGYLLQRQSEFSKIYGRQFSLRFTSLLSSLLITLFFHLIHCPVHLVHSLRIFLEIPCSFCQQSVMHVICICAVEIMHQLSNGGIVTVLSVHI